MKNKWKLVLLSSLGGGLEFYDFIIFAIFSIEIGNSFFPQSSQAASLIGAYSLFAIGYLVRPLGGIIFSHFGDKNGRKKTFALTISIMAIATLLMSVTPDYSHWGLMATFLFTLLRVIQGMSIGGEIPGAITFVSEHVYKRPGLACGLIIFFLNLGMILAQAVRTALVHLMDEEAFHLYGWRVAFLIGGLLAIVSFYLRKNLKETPAFLANENRERYPLLHLLKNHLKPTLSGILITGLSATCVSIYLLYINAYLQVHQQYPAILASRLVLWQLIVMCVSSPLASYLSDFIGRRLMLFVGAIAVLFSAIPFFIGLKQILWSTPLFIANGVVISIYLGAMPCYLSELFSASVRYSGVALSYNIGFALFGGLTPLIASLVMSTSKQLLVPAYIVTSVAVIALLTLMFLAPKDSHHLGQPRPSGDLA